VSLLSSERLVVAVHERGIDALRVRNGHLPRSQIRVVERHRFDSDTLTSSVPANTSSWQRSVALLRDLAGCGVRQLHLVLSNHFVRYQLLPWESIVACNGDTQALARARFQLAFGEAAVDWHIVADAPRFRTTSLTAAIDGQLLPSAREMAATAGLQIASVRPYLLSALGRWQAGLRPRAIPNAGWFALFEPGRLTVLGSAPSSTASLYNIRLHAPEALVPTLLQCVAADRLRSARDGSVYLHASGWSGSDRELASIVRIDRPGAEKIDGAPSDFGQSMAWCGCL